MMQGFDPQYEDLTDYILKCTAMIWEGRGIGELEWHYGDDLLVRTPAGISRGNAAGKANTMATLVEFPDRQLLGEDVIWSGDAEAGFLSSHRIISTATHRGGALGVATGLPVRFRTIADTYCKDNRVWDEWLVRDNGAIAVQIGRSSREVAEEMIAQGRAGVPLTPQSDEAGPYAGRGNDNEWGARHADVLRAIMAADFAVIGRAYDRACHVSLPEGVEGHGWAAVDQFWVGLRAAFPDAEFKIEHQIGREDAMMPPRGALRWSMSGTHSGWGRFGRPTGAPVHVMGVSHAEFGPRGIRRETVIFDDIAIWTQILQNDAGRAT